jgi:universal stress protein F
MVQSDDRARARQGEDERRLRAVGGTILVALDASARAPAVLAKAIALASAQGERLVLFRSVGLPAEIPQDLWRSTDEPLLDVLDRRARAYLEECEAKVPSAVRGGTEVAIGTPWQSICEAAHRRGCDLIVIGSHGYSGFDRVLGTTAAKVVNHATCSVLVVRSALTEGAS